MGIVLGRGHAQAVRGALVGIGKRLRKGKLKDEELFELLNHQKRLTEELKEIAIATLRAQIAKQEKVNTSGLDTISDT